MKRKNISIFLGEKVKLVKGDFCLYGIVTDIDGDHVFFQTDTKTSMIHLDVITEITPID